MKKFILVLFIICNIPGRILSQIDESSILYNLSIGASNPAFNILDLSPSKIERPRDPNDFALLLQNASDNFSLIPRNYSIEISSWIFHPKVSYSNFNSTKNIGRNIYQSLAISLATSTDSSENTTRFGTGIKFSILRGKIKSITGITEEYKAKLDTLHGVNEMFMNEKRKSDEAYSKLGKEIDSLSDIIESSTDEAQISEIEQKIDSLLAIQKQRQDTLDSISRLELKTANEELIKRLEEESSKIQFIREGPKLDFAAAFAFDFPEQNFNKGKYSKFASWLILGNDWVSKNKDMSTSLFGISKIILIKDTIDDITSEYKIKSYYDFGIRFIQQVSGFSLSGEAIWSTKFDPAYLIDFGYNAGDNKLIIFSIGKESGGTPYRKGNLIAALNFLIGIGAERPLDKAGLGLK